MLKSILKSVLYLFVLIGFSAAHSDPSVQFFRAVNVDDERTVGALLKAGFDPNTRSEAGQTGLFTALRDESPKVAALLIAHPCTQIDAPNGNDETALMMAALRGQLDMARRLLERGAAVNRPGWTPLHYAGSGPEPRMVALLLERGAAVDARSPNGSTALMLAASYGPEAAIDLLLARGASLQARNDRGLGAAEFAERAGRESLAERLRAAAR